MYHPSRCVDLNPLWGFRTRPARSLQKLSLLRIPQGKRRRTTRLPSLRPALVRCTPAPSPPAPRSHGRARPGRETSRLVLLSPHPHPRGGLSHLVVPGRVAPQHLAPHGHLEGPVGQLRLRRLLFPPPAAHPPVAPPDPGLGRAGRAKRSRVWDGGSQRAGRRQSKQ